MGLYSRGIKTRLGKQGTDYYGIIRHAVEQDLTCVLIEHCHMDHENDRPFCEGREQWEAFGRLDAQSAPKYFHLKSNALGVDYSDYPVMDVPIPAGVMRPDTTEPDICMIEVTDQEMETGNVTVELSAVDYDSGMLYYDYSYDGGNTFSPRIAWGDKTKDTITFTMHVPPHIVPQIVVRSYNGYDLYTESNLVSLPSMDYKTEEEIAAELAEQERIAAAKKGRDRGTGKTECRFFGKSGEETIRITREGGGKATHNQLFPDSMSGLRSACGQSCIVHGIDPQKHKAQEASEEKAEETIKTVSRQAVFAAYKLSERPPQHIEQGGDGCLNRFVAHIGAYGQIRTADHTVGLCKAGKTAEGQHNQHENGM